MVGRTEKNAMGMVQQAYQSGHMRFGQVTRALRVQDFKGQRWISYLCRFHKESETGPKLLYFGTEADPETEPEALRQRWTLWKLHWLDMMSLTHWKIFCWCRHDGPSGDAQQFYPPPTGFNMICGSFWLWASEKGWSSHLREMKLREMAVTSRWISLQERQKSKTMGQTLELRWSREPFEVSKCLWGWGTQHFL